MARRAILLLWLAGCGGGSSTPVGDASVSTPDAPVAAAHFSAGCGILLEPITELQMPTTQVGQTANERVTFSSGSLTSLMITFDGPDAALFSAGDSVGGVLLDHVTFTPTSPGTFHATLHAKNAGGFASLPITATAVAATGPLQFSTPAFHVAGAPLGPIRLTNRSTSTAITLDSLLASSDEFAVSGCTGVLLPGESCNVAAEAIPRSLGCLRATITATSSQGTATVAVDASSIASVTVQSYGGTVSSAAGDCTEQDCYPVFSALPMTFTAMAATGNRFVGWNVDTGCGAEPTCTLSLAQPMPKVVPSFVPEANADVAITINGPSFGSVLVVEDGRVPIVCNGSCTVSRVSATAGLKLVAATSGRFVGWSGACTGSVVQCNLGQSIADTSLTATFAADPTEVAKLPVAAWDAAFLPGGDLVTNDRGTLTRITSTGTVVWRRTTNAAEVVSSAAGDVYYVSYASAVPRLYKLDASGAAKWNRTVAPVSAPEPCGDHRHLAVASNGNVAFVSDGTLRMIAPTTGLDIWTATVTACGGLAASPLGPIAVVSYAAQDPVIRRFDPMGTALTPDWTFGPATQTDLAFDSQGALVTYSLDTTVRLQKLDAAGTPVFSIPMDVQATSLNAMAIAANGTIVTTSITTDSSRALELRWTSATGAPLSSTTNTGVVTASAVVYSLPRALAADSTGRVALGVDQWLGASDAPYGGLYRSSIHLLLAP